MFFSVFWNFYFLGCLGGKRLKNSPKWKITIRSVCQQFDQSHISYDCHLWYTSVKWYYLQALKNLIFRVVRRVKVQKKGPKWQKTFSFALYISGTIHHMILIYGAHQWKENIYKCFLHFFKILILGSIVGWKSKRRPKMTKISQCLCYTPYLSKHTLFDCVFCCTNLK